MALTSVSLQYAATPAPFSVSLEKSAEISQIEESSQSNGSNLDNSNADRNQQGTVVQLRDQNDDQAGFSARNNFSADLLDIQEQYVKTFEEFSDVPTQNGPLFDEEKTALNQILSQINNGETAQEPSVNFVI